MRIDRYVFTITRYNLCKDEQEAEQEEAQGAGNELVITPRERAGVAIEPRRSAWRRAEDGRVDTEDEGSTVPMAERERAAQGQEIGAGKERVESRCGSADGGPGERTQPGEPTGPTLQPGSTRGR